MHVYAFRVSQFVFSLALILGVHGAEFRSAAALRTATGCHDCGCATECSCRGPVKGCACGQKGTSLKTTCGCGCSKTMHMGATSFWESILCGACTVGAPDPIWTPTPGLGESHSWRLAYEYEHPPRASS